MIDFDLTEEHRLLEQTVKEWAGREVAPRIKALDREHRFDKGILPQMADLGLLGVSVPVEYGGAGMDYVSLGVASEELEYVDTSLRVILSVHVGLNCLSLLTWGTEAQKRQYLVPQAKGEKIATFALTEPSAGSDARGIKATAVKQGDRYVLNGEKMWISLADVADHVLVIAWSDLEKMRAARHRRAERLHRRAPLQGVLERHADREVGHPRRQHRLPEVRRRRGPGREPRRAGGRGLQDRDVRARSGPLHGRRRRHRPDPRLPRRVGEVRARSPHVRRRDRPAPAGQGDDRAHGGGLPVDAPPVAAIRLAEERGAPQHARDGPRQVDGDDRLGARRRRRGADPRRQRLLRRVPGRPLLSQLQGRGDLRGHARDPHHHAGRLPPRLSHRSADALRAAALQGATA